MVLPGLPVNADTWAGVAGALGDVRVADLPGLGLSGGGPGDWGSWAAALEAGAPGRLHVIVGDRDPLTQEGRELLDALPQATVTVIAGAGCSPTPSG
ncbi:Alpha/beta hydrolase family protein [Nonomuraea coxensis DSM 45129]|uniref:Alpha/beta hydrolase family protein n=1 Tax=Nonomuraea coxensis DSM 45129 TaxID=1122611 RepID=A0ABX8U3Y0_9ACTN|nr:hypothetical protein [Nonomuraea coxensis]QYC41459.1 Alpha/beta hydrolase family protein [Nonomuraea coxensis DSM 45129]